VTVAVESDLVAGIDDRTRHRWLLPHLFADEEERRTSSLPFERIQDGRSSVDVRPVVEREHDRILAPEPTGDPDLTGQPV
jgi:hypothetical protein